MLDSLVHIPILRVGLCQLFMSFASLGLIVRFFTQVQEFVQKFYRLVKVSKHLVDVSNFLIALCLLVSILSALGCVQALLEKLKRLVEIVLVLELDGDNLVHSDKLSRDFLFDFAQVSINSFLKSSFQIAHGVENVEDFLFANSETHVCFGLSLDELGLDGLLAELRAACEILDAGAARQVLARLVTEYSPAARNHDWRVSAAEESPPLKLNPLSQAYSE